nr:(2Fe-2S)-binding protein [Sphingomonas crocodyli]
MLTIDGVGVTADEGEPLAAVLLRNAPYSCRRTPVSGASRAPFCMMGVCFECLVEVDGATSTRSCLVRVRDGLDVRRQNHRPGPDGGLA